MRGEILWLERRRWSDEEKLGIVMAVGNVFLLMAVDDNSIQW
jgi:hypothetical protein